MKPVIVVQNGMKPRVERKPGAIQAMREEIKSEIKRMSKISEFDRVVIQCVCAKQLVFFDKNEIAGIGTLETAKDVIFGY